MFKVDFSPFLLGLGVGPFPWALLLLLRSALDGVDPPLRNVLISPCFFPDFHLKK